MSRFTDKSELLDALSAPMGDLIASVGKSVAEAQQAMDRQAMENFRAIYGDHPEAFAELRSIGYQPSWYTIPEVSAEIAVALTLEGTEGRQQGSTRPWRTKVAIRAAPVDAGYSNRFNYRVQASSSLRFKIVPVPPPTAAVGMSIAPNLAGMSIAAARTFLEDLAIELDLGGTAPTEDAVIVSQQPAAGDVVPTDGAISVQVNPSA